MSDTRMENMSVALLSRTSILPPRVRQQTKAVAKRHEAQYKKLHFTEPEKLLIEKLLTIK